MTTYLIVSFVAKYERLADFHALLERVKVELPNVPGCQGLDVYQAAEHPTHFTLVEAWTSPAQHQAHVENMQRSGGWEILTGHLAADPVYSYFRRL